MIPEEKKIAFFDRLQKIFGDMDRKYDIAAQSYGFQCRGCEENCCRTRFYHHTYLEYLYLRQGFGSLDASQQRALRTEAAEVCRQTELADNEGRAVRLMCPLNKDGMCTLYAFRPMICRLHGIPHELQKPGQPVMHGPGCGLFEQQCSAKPYFKFDRTRFYFEMARLENEFKQAAGLSGRARLTIAEMLIF